MASKITAIRKYRPELKRSSTLQSTQLIENLVAHSALSAGAVWQAVFELRDEILAAHRRGRAVKIAGLGTFTPTLGVDGTLGISFRADAGLLKDLNNTTQLFTSIVNKGSIGKTSAELVARWNAEHPDDPVREEP